MTDPVGASGLPQVLQELIAEMRDFERTKPSGQQTRQKSAREMVGVFASKLEEAAIRAIPLPSPEVLDQLAAAFAGVPESFATPLDHYREMARRFAESRDELKHRCRALEGELQAVREQARAPQPPAEKEL